jgi:hypothetical protein
MLATFDGRKSSPGIKFFKKIQKRKQGERKEKEREKLIVKGSKLAHSNQLTVTKGNKKKATSR